MALQFLPLTLSSLFLSTVLLGGDLLTLPAPPVGGRPLSEALMARRSVRDFTPKSLSLTQLAAILWAGQGLNRPDGRRTVPSAGATYPLELYLLTEGAKDLPRGTYKYLPKTHQLRQISDRGVGGSLGGMVLQDWVKISPALIVVASVESRTAARYGGRGLRYVHMEAGACAQNLALQAAALGLGCAIAGAFDDLAIKRVLALPAEEDPLLVIPIGNPKRFAP
jgi:SagB-type dehydrogenase family enzyme